MPWARDHAFLSLDNTTEARMAVAAGVPGKLKKIAFEEHMTAGQALCRSLFHDYEIRVNGEKRSLDDAIKNEDTVLALQSILGHQVIADVNEGMRLLKTYSDGATDFIIVDPFILWAPHKNVPPYINRLSDCLNLANGTLKKLHLVWGTTRPAPDVLTALSAKCSLHRCAFSAKDTEAIHDRVWIRDRNQAWLVGGSFNFLGGRLCFTLPLPDADFKIFCEFLANQNLL
jgi:hypothetical protein